MRTYQTPSTQVAPLPFARPTLQTEQLLAIYARQSTKEQVLKNHEAYDQQTIGLVKRATELGWDRSRILVYIENKRADGKWVSASGRLRIDQRAGLQALSERIERNDDRKRFLDAAQAAADYVTKHVKGRMLPAREQMSLRGQSDSRRIAVGYIVVDRQRYLADGSDNPNYRRLVVYEPHARVVKWLFRRYRELDGNLRALYREILTWPYVFPFFTDPIHARYTGLSKNSKGYTITQRGLATLLTNPIYLGWWYYKGQIVSKTNHDAIVSDADFWYAFNRLSPITIEGESNDLMDVPPARYTHDGTPPLEALLDGIIAEVDSLHGSHYKQSIGVAVLDTIFVTRLLHVIDHTEHGATLQDHLIAVRSARTQQLVSVDEQITEAKQQIAKWERSRRIAQEEGYEAGEREAVRELKSKSAVLRALELKQEESAVDDEDLVELATLLFGASVGWSEFTFERKQRFIRLSTQSITLSEVSTHFLKLEVVWTGPYARTDSGYIWRRRPRGWSYTEEDNAILQALYPSADRATILDRLPHRNWSGIQVQARELGLSRARSCRNSSSLHMDLSRDDHVICEMLGVEYEETWPDKLTWWITSTNGNSETPSRNNVGLFYG